MALNEAISRLDWHFQNYGSVSDRDAYEYLKTELARLKKIHERVYCPMRTSEYGCMPMDVPCADIEDNVCNGLRKAYNSSCIGITTTTANWVEYD